MTIILKICTIFADIENNNHEKYEVNDNTLIYNEYNYMNPKKIVFR